MKSPLPLCLALGAFALLSLPASAATYYVHATSGNDANNGTSTSTPWRTLARVNNGPLNNGGSYAAGDQILLSAGQSWTGQLKPKGSGTSASPILIGKYGSGGWPVITNSAANTASGNAAIYLLDVAGYEVKQLQLRAPTAHAAVEVRTTTSGTKSYFRLTDLICYDLAGTVRAGGGIVFRNETTTTAPGKFDNVVIANCTIWNVGGIGIQHTTTVSDGTPTSLRMTNSTIRNCVIHQCGQDGIVWRAADGAVIEYTTVFDTGNDKDRALAGIWFKNANGGTIQFCEGFLNTDNGQDGMAFDFDIDVDNSTLQYSYSHDNDGGFVLICGCSPDTSLYSDGNVVRYNVSENDADKTFYFASRVRNSSIYNNTIYVASSVALNKVIENSGSGQSGNQWRNNIFVIQNAATFDTAGHSFSHNVFFGSGISSSPTDANKLTSDPLFVSANSGGIGLGSVGGYRLQSTSPARDSGASITGNGGRDYIGTTLYQGSPDRGAFEWRSYSGIGAPSAPSGLTANGNGSDHIRLNWTDNSAVEEGYKIERKPSGGAYTQIATAGPGETRYIDYGLATGTAYTYRVRGTNAVGDSAYSNEATATAP